MWVFLFSVFSIFLLSLITFVIWFFARKELFWAYKDLIFFLYFYFPFLRILKKGDKNIEEEKEMRD